MQPILSAMIVTVEEKLRLSGTRHYSIKAKNVPLSQLICLKKRITSHHLKLIQSKYNFQIKEITATFSIPHNSSQSLSFQLNRPGVTGDQRLSDFPHCLHFQEMVGTKFNTTTIKVLA